MEKEREKERKKTVKNVYSPDDQFGVDVLSQANHRDARLSLLFLKKNKRRYDRIFLLLFKFIIAIVR